MTKTRTLSKLDSISHSKALDIFKHTTQTEGGLIIPKEHETFRENRCGFCGQGYGIFEAKGRYFGEVFHAKCCEAMLRGEKYE